MIINLLDESDQPDRALGAHNLGCSTTLRYKFFINYITFSFRSGNLFGVIRRLIT